MSTVQEQFIEYNRLEQEELLSNSLGEIVLGLEVTDDFSQELGSHLWVVILEAKSDNLLSVNIEGSIVQQFFVEVGGQRSVLNLVVLAKLRPGLQVLVVLNKASKQYLARSREVWKLTLTYSGFSDSLHGNGGSQLGLEGSNVGGLNSEDFGN